MVPPLGKITSFFKPYVVKSEKQRDRNPEEYDGDNITVATRPPMLAATSSTQTVPVRQLDSQKKPLLSSPPTLSQKAPVPRLDSLTRSISPGRGKHIPSQAANGQHHEEMAAKEEEPSSPLSILSPSPSKSLSVRTVKMAQRPNNVMDEPIAPLVLKPTPTNAVTSSFSSTSSSKRIVKDGMKAVTNSDSDSMSSSGDEFEDVSSFMPRKRMKLTPPGSNPTLAIVLQDDDTPRPVKAKWSKPAPKKYRHSLQSLVKQAERDEASSVRIKQVEADVQEQRNSKAVATTDVFADDSDRERIQAAMNRVEACEESDEFYFFRQTCDDIPEPTFWTQDPMIASLLQKGAPRDTLVKSGFLTDLAEQVGISQEVLTWVYWSLQRESSQPICEQYLQMLQASCRQASRQNKVVTALYHSSLREVYLHQTEQGSRIPHGLPSGLGYCLRLLVTLLDSTSTPDRATTLADLFLLNVDEHVRADLEIQAEIDDALRWVLLWSDLQPAFLQPAIQLILGSDELSPQQVARGIAILPATTTALHTFRRQIALRYMLHTDKDYDVTEYATGALLLKAIEANRLFTIKPETNWTLFYWTVNLLDICIDVGFSNFDFMTSSTSETHEEKNFNRQIDDFAQRLRLISNSIRDAGTSHLRRTEAKGALDRLVIRVELSVRTRPKRKAAVFGGKIGSGQQDLFKNFLTAESEDDEDDALQTWTKAPHKALNDKSVHFVGVPADVEVG